jgi:hypothetical protein
VPGTAALRQHRAAERPVAAEKCQRRSV